MKPKILVVAPNDIYQNLGLVKTLRQFLPSLTDEFNIFVLYSDSQNNSGDSNQYAEDGLNRIFIKCPSLHGLEFWIGLIVTNIYALLNYKKFDMFVGNNNSLFILCLLRRFLKLKKPVITIFQNVKSDYYSASKTKPLWSGLIVFMDRTCALRSDNIVGVSMGVKNGLVSNYKVDPRAIEVIYNFVQERQFKRLSVYPDKKNIWFISNDNERKGIDIFNSIAKSFVNDKELRFKVAGRDSKHIASLENVEYVGPLSQSEIQEQLSKAFLLILPSKNEGHPFVAIESLAVGTPVIGSIESNIEICFGSYCDFTCRRNDVGCYIGYIKNLLIIENYIKASKSSIESVKKLNSKIQILKYRDVFKKHINSPVDK